MKDLAALACVSKITVRQPHGDPRDAGKHQGKAGILSKPLSVGYMIEDWLFKNSVVKGSTKTLR